MEFRDLGLNEALLRRCESQNFTTPTPIQEKAVPIIKEGGDLIGCAETGSGKTAAFLLPLLDGMISRRPPGVSLLVIAPTRELALQIEEDYNTFAPKRFQCVTLIGGANVNKQTKKLKSGVSAVIATPGRLIDHVERGNVDLRTIDTLVLDEADRMLDMGFLPQIRRVLGFLPQKRQSLLFSATLADSVKGLAYSVLKEPSYVEVNPKNEAAASIDQVAYPVPANSKIALLIDLLESGKLDHVIVFCATKRGADRLSHILEAREVNVGTIHADRTQSQRERVLRDFKSGKKEVLIATDIASRGLDIDSITHVINFDVPNTPEDYVHRVGRTGRAGKLGQAITLVTPAEELAMREIERHTNQEVTRIEHPEFSVSAVREKTASFLG